jgi:glycosyltransferase involved in cell wall biosynthesis
MFASKPIVASDVGDIGAALGGYGRLVLPGDAAGLAEALDQLLSDPAGAKRLGEAASARAQAEYGIDRMTDRYKSLYQRALERR